MYNDYYEGEIDVKPSDIRWRHVEFNKDGDVLEALIANQFDKSPYPIIMIKTSENIVAYLSPGEDDKIISVGPYVDSDVPVTVENFMQRQTLAEQGYLLIGWITADSSLIGVSKQ